MPLCVRHAIIGLAAVLATGLADPAGATRRREAVETVAARPAGEPIMAIVSLSNQRVTIYDADGWILRAPVSSGQTGYETPAGVYSVIQKEEEHYSNLYDDASMPFMQRITWSGIALHAGPLPGYPASHGCVRMPYEFAQRLFDMTKIGMRVIVARNDVSPVEIDHPVLFKPKLVRADLALKALTAHWDAAREEAQAAAPDAAPPEADGPSPASPAKPLVQGTVIRLLFRPRLHLPTLIRHRSGSMATSRVATRLPMTPTMAPTRLTMRCPFMTSILGTGRPRQSMCSWSSTLAFQGPCSNPREQNPNKSIPPVFVEC